MIPLPSSDATLTSRVIRDMGKAVHAEILCAHVLRALPGLWCPSFFHFFVFLGTDAGDGRRLPGLPRVL